MARSALEGSRIRERRSLLGLRQADVARAAGISPAYLNLIEHNRRRVGPEVLARLAEALSTEAAALTEGGEAALIDGLRAAAAAPGAAAEIDRLEEFAGRFPGWAALLAGQGARIEALERRVEALGDRIAHDPALSSALHEVLSAATSIRSTAAILAETEDLDPEWLARFHGNLHRDSERLAGAAGGLVTYLDAEPGEAGKERGLATPQEEMEAWFAANGWQADGAGPLPPAAAAGLTGRWQDRFRADAAALADADLGRQLAVGEDPGRIAERAGADLATVLRRIAVLPDGPPGAGLFICDGAGAFTFRKPAPGFAAPRHGPGCPLWPLYQAVSRPMLPVQGLVEIAGRQDRRYRTYAVCQPLPGAFGLPQLVEATMLILPAPPGAQGPVIEAGSTCRLCPRAGCPARREQSLLAEG